MKKAAYDIIMGILPVMIGVYLGIYFNNRNEEQQQDELKNQIFKNLLAESQSNLEILKDSQAYFEMLRDSSNAYLVSKRPYKQFSFWKGLNPPELSVTAFKTAEVTNILPDLPISLLQSLSKTYSSISDIKNLGNVYFSRVIDNTGDPNYNDREYLIILENYSWDMIIAEESISEQIEILIELLQSQQQVSN